jgi:serine/threonine protein phosphatase PrpC
MACFCAGDALCGIVCDGAGSAEHGGEGASVISHTIANALRRHFRQSPDLPDDDNIWSWVDAARGGEAGQDAKGVRRHAGHAGCHA